MKKIFSILVILLFLQNCASLKEPKTKGTLNEKNLTTLNGQYSNHANSGGGSHVNKLSDVFDRNDNMFKSRIDEKYASKNVSVYMKVISEKTLNIIFKDNNQIILDKNIKVKLMKDGFLYINENKLKIIGLPLISGGWNVQKSRLTINSEGKMYVESNYFFCNGILIVMSDWKDFNYELTFEKK